MTPWWHYDYWYEGWEWAHISIPDRSQRITVKHQWTRRVERRVIGPITTH